MSVVPTNVPVSTSVPTLTLAAGSAGGVAIASTIDPAVDYLLIYTASAVATQGINRNTLLGLSSQPLGLNDVQSPTNKTFGVTNTFTPLDGSFTLKNTTDPTKLAKFSLAGITTGTTRTYTLPNASGTLMDLASAQTAANKTLTSPIINSPTITNASLTTDAITGFTVSNTGSIFGISVATGAFTTANIIPTASLQNASVTASKLATGAATNGVATVETTTSVAYADLATSGPAVTVTIGANGQALVSIGGSEKNSGSNFSFIGYAVSGATTVAASDTTAFGGVNTSESIGTKTVLVTGLTPGSNTFTAKYRVAAGTGTFERRLLTVVPL